VAVSSVDGRAGGCGRLIARNGGASCSPAAGTGS
jgi:hypothetical protein